ncbi:hypothetical protein BJ508DRAFT_163786 [Ascobolus immersus RN42]|uniref:Uncharacterized protein n=1 Tax=Ascobolus immersus RN42 TaxID=1160509 RepID=A0A3N4HXL0_ASCIM|nr:hypothetical protein BJ508DRAFT_163786 [Ascobolus immersus RN42]
MQADLSEARDCGWLLMIDDSIPKMRPRVCLVYLRGISLCRDIRCLRVISTLGGISTPRYLVACVRRWWYWATTVHLLWIGVPRIYIRHDIEYGYGGDDMGLFLVVDAPDAVNEARSLAEISFREMSDNRPWQCTICEGFGDIY